MRKLMKCLMVGALLLTTAACEPAPSMVRGEPDPTDLWQVNTQTYNHDDHAPVRIAYEAVARHRGWSDADIAAWDNFLVNDVIAKESGSCPNVLGGATFANGGVGCELARQGRRGDAGFGQLIGIHYKGWLCVQEGLCSKWEVIETPWASMTALLALVERSGKAGWCYSNWARSYHRGCATAPRGVPLTTFD